MAEPPSSQRPIKVAADLARFAGFGVQLVAALALFGCVGWWLDRRLSTGPWLLILGLLGGAALAFVSLLKAVPGGWPGKKPPHGTE
jgi:F0F1-type ATP synthase assembly protein I